MAKIALVAVFSLALFLSIQSVVGDEAFTQGLVDGFTSGLDEAIKSVSNSVENAEESVEDTSATWTSWAKDQLRDFGLLSPKETLPSSSTMAPENAPAPKSSSSYGSKLAAAPAF